MRHRAQNAGALDGILSVSKSLNIEDPQIFKIGVLDSKRCKYCWKLWNEGMSCMEISRQISVPFQTLYKWRNSNVV